jgi:hypothetical protein
VNDLLRLACVRAELYFWLLGDVLIYGSLLRAGTYKFHRLYSLARGEVKEDAEGVAALAGAVIATVKTERGAKEAVHDFVDKTFAQPTYCALCKTLIWSFKKGLTCTVCAIAAHEKVHACVRVSVGMCACVCVRVCARAPLPWRRVS